MRVYHVNFKCIIAVYNLQVFGACIFADDKNVTPYAAAADGKGTKFVK